MTCRKQHAPVAERGRVGIEEAGRKARHLRPRSGFNVRQSLDDLGADRVSQQKSKQCKR